MWINVTDWPISMSELNSIVHNFSLYINEIIYWWLWYLREISWQILIAFSAYLCVCVVLYIVLKKVGHKPWQLPGPPARILLVTAHPDDEVMFFGPLIYWVVQQKTSEIYLLCLTIGGDKGRKEELWACAKILGIPEANITILMNTQLSDDRMIRWPESIVADNILYHVESYKINAVVTFDKRGVSGHENHISLFYGVASLCMECKIPPYCKLYVLESVNIVRKYIQLLDLPISLLSASYWYLVTYSQQKVIWTKCVPHQREKFMSKQVFIQRISFSRYKNYFSNLTSVQIKLNRADVGHVKLSLDQTEKLGVAYEITEISRVEHKRNLL